jgi:hypothetical protein
VSRRRIELVLLAIAIWYFAIAAVGHHADARRAAQPLPAIGVIELAQLERQAHALCAHSRGAPAYVSLPDGVLVCMPTDHAQPTKDATP